MQDAGGAGIAYTCTAALAVLMLLMMLLMMLMVMLVMMLRRSTAISMPTAIAIAIAMLTRLSITNASPDDVSGCGLRQRFDQILILACEWGRGVGGCTNAVFPHTPERSTACHASR